MIHSQNHEHEHDHEHGHDHENGHDAPWTTMHHGHDNHDHEEHGDHGYPLAALLLCTGFFMIYWIEAITHRIYKGKHGSHGHSHGIPPNMLQTDRLNDNESQKATKDKDNNSM